MTIEDGTRFMVMAPVVRGRKGEYGKLLEQLRARGLRPRSGGRRAAAAGREDRARQEVQARHLGGGRPAGDEEGPAAPALGVDRGRRAAGRRGGRDRHPRLGQSRRDEETVRVRSDQGRRRAARESPSAQVFSEQLRLPQLRHLDPRAGAADLLLQLSPWCLRALPRARLSAGGRSRPGRPRPDSVACRRGRCSRGRTAHSRYWRAAGRSRSPGLRCRRRYAMAGAEATRDRKIFLYGTGSSATRSTTRTFGRRRSYSVRFEGIVNQPRAPLRGYRLRRGARTGRGLYGRAALPRLRRRPAAAGEPRRSSSAGSASERVHRALGARRASPGSASWS